MTALQRIIAVNLAWRFGVQVPVFVAYAALSRGLASTKEQQS